MTISVFKVSQAPAHARKTAQFRRAAKLALGRDGKKEGSLNIIFMNSKEMRALNKKFLNHDYDTDVISFPYDDKPAFGDVFVSVAQAKRQAVEVGHSLLKEILTLIIHGVLHLRGYRDDKPALKKKMFKEQDRLLLLLE
jgi:probable rRNA maturation factor